MGDVIELRPTTNMRVHNTLDKDAVGALTDALAREVTRHNRSRPPAAAPDQVQREVLNAIAAVVGTVTACSDPGPEQNTLLATFAEFLAVNVEAANVFQQRHPGAIERAMRGGDLPDWNMEG